MTNPNYSRGVREIKGLAPPMQFFIVNLFDRAMKAKYSRDIERYAKGIWMIYMNLPPNIKEEISRELAQTSVVKELFGDVEAVTPQHIIEYIDDDCGRYISTYTRFKEKYVKKAECREKIEQYLDLIYDTMLEVVYKHNFLVFMSSPVMYGGYWGGDYMGGEKD